MQQKPSTLLRCERDKTELICTILYQRADCHSSYCSTDTPSSLKSECVLSITLSGYICCCHTLHSLICQMCLVTGNTAKHQHALDSKPCDKVSDQPFVVNPVHYRLVNGNLNGKPRHIDIPLNT